MSEDIGKKAEKKIKEWLDRPEEGYSFDRIPDQMTGQFGSRNICDFTCFKSPKMYYIESKCTEADRFDFAMITDTQREGLLKKAPIEETHGWIIVLFATYQRAFVLNIQDIQWLIDQGIKSLNIKKIDRWKIPYKEIRTVPNKRKYMLDYYGEIEEYIPDKRIS